jgi:hypothetical protein
MSRIVIAIVIYYPHKFSIVLQCVVCYIILRCMMQRQDKIVLVLNYLTIMP